MDIFNFSKLVEQGVYDVMMWILFYPLSLLRTLLQPRKILAYVREQFGVAPEEAFANGMRPALFLFISICMVSFLSPMDNAEIAQYQRSDLGKMLMGSALPMLVFNTLIFSLLPLTGAVMLDFLNFGRVTRNSLRLPFEQQCYISAPFALLVSILVISFKGRESRAEIILLALLVGWFLLAQYFFFRDNSKFGAPACGALAAATFVIGFGMIASAIALTVGFA